MGAAQRQLARRHRRVRKEMDAIQKELPTGMEATIAFDSTKYIDSAIHEVDAHAARDGAHRHRRHLPVPRIAPHRARPGGRDSGVAHRRGLPHAGVRVHAEPAHAARRSCSRSVSWSTTPSSSSRTSSGTSAKGKTPVQAALDGARELVGPIIAMTITLAAVYAPIGFQGGLTGALFREFAFTLAGAVFISGVVALTLSPMMSSKLLRAEHAAGSLGRAASTARFDRVKRTLRARARRTLARAPGGLRGVDRAHAARRADVHVLARTSSRPTRTRASSSAPSTCRANATLEQLTPVHRGRSNKIFESTPEFDHSFQITFPDRRLRRHAGEAVGRAQAEHLPHPGASSRSKLSAITGVRAPAFLPPALPSAGTFPVEFVIASTAEPRGAAPLRADSSCRRR